MKKTSGDSQNALIGGHQGYKVHAARQNNLYNREEKKKTKCAGGWGLPVVGLSLLVFAVLLFLLNPAQMAVTMARRFNSGWVMYESWLNPPMKINLKFHVFNYTNMEAFLRGEEKLRVEDIGPYAFREYMIIEDPTFNENNTLTYRPKHRIEDDPGESVGNPLEDIIVVPNFVYLGLASYLADSSIFTNTAFNLFAKLVKSEPFYVLTVDEYLRGHEEPLLKYASKILPHAVPISKLSFLDTIIKDGENVVTMNLNGEREATADGGVREPYSVQLYNGAPGMEHWGYDVDDDTTHEICNTFKGVATEGSLAPRELTPDLRINYYRKAFCRTVPIVFDRPGVSTMGVPAFWLKFKEDTYNTTNPENTCYCREEPCLPDGVTDMSPCFFDMPWAMSNPHFLYGDPSLVEAVEGLSPRIQEHGTTGLLDSTFGVILHAHLRLQVNLAMKHTKYNMQVRPFNGLMLPAIWIDYHFHDLPVFHHTLIYLCVVVLPVASHVLVALLLVAGFALVLRHLFRTTNSFKAVYHRLFLYARSSPRHQKGKPRRMDVP